MSQNYEAQVRRLIATYQALPTGPPRLYQDEHLQAFQELRSRAERAAEEWTQLPGCNVSRDPDVYPHLSMNSHRHRVGVDFFLHQVNPEEQDWPTEYPMAPSDAPEYMDTCIDMSCQIM